LETGKAITNSIGMKLVLLPAGEFQMGSLEDESYTVDCERLHRVQITKPFYLAQTETTQGQWESVMGTRRWGHSVRRGRSVVATNVSWNDAQKFCQRLSEKESMTYRLPTEAEWEYACRAGTTSAYYFGNDESQLGDYAWFKDNGERINHKVALKRANGFGLFDMHGNAREFCHDWYENPYADSPQSDPTGPSSGTHRVIRGGCYMSPSWACRSGYRSRCMPGTSYCHVGFRVVAIPPAK
jgi:formylglycine-generating enzyme